MARDKLAYSIGNAASSVLSSGMSNTDTTAIVTSTTNFKAKSGEGEVLLDEGTATEEIAYATAESGGTLTIPLANRGLEGGTAQTHAASSTVKGVLTAGMWNDLIDSLTNILVKSTGAVDTTKVVTASGTATFTNKRITKRVSTTTSSATPTPNADTDDEYTVTALAAGATFGAPTGTPTEGQPLTIRIKDNATARSLAFNAIYRFSTDLAAPTTTVISKTMYIGFIYNATDTKWDCVALLNNF